MSVRSVFRLNSWIMVAVGVASLLAAASMVSAQTLTWDANGTGSGSDGSGTWSTASMPMNWSNGSLQPWTDGNTAVFGSGGAAGTVTVSGQIQPSGIKFDSVSSENYVITGSAIDLFNAATPITLNVNATIASALVGTGGLSVSGGNVLTLSGSGNSYSGQTLLTSGTITIGGGASISGVYEGLVSSSNSFDQASPIPRTSIQSVARWGATNAGSNDPYGNNVFPTDGGGTGWNKNTTWGYTTYLNNTTGGLVTYNFGKNFDDSASLVIDGATVINNTNWSQDVTGSITLGPGLHTVALRFGQGTGGVGPTNNDYNHFGISYNTAGNTGAGGTWLQLGATDASTQFEAVPAGAANSAMVMSGNTTLDLSAASTGLLALGSLADAAGATGHQVLLGSNTLNVGLDCSSTTFSGAISGNGGSLLKGGSGMLLLAGTNSYSGTTTVSLGVLEAATTAALPGYSSTPIPANVIPGAILAARTTDGSTGWSSDQIDRLAANANWISSASVLGLDTSNANFTYGSNVTAALTLGKLGANTLFLTGTNTNSGGTQIQAGTLNINGDTALGATGATMTFTGNSTLQAGVDAIVIGSARNITINNGVTATIDTQAFNMSVAASIGGPGTLTKVGGGTLTLTAANPLNGNTTLSAGTLVLSNSGALQNSTLVMNGGSLVFDSSVANSAFTFGGLSAANAGSGYDIVLENNAGTPAPVALTVGTNNAWTGYAGVLSGSGSLIKTGNGFLTLTGPNTYSGGTTVNGGVLVINTDAQLGAVPSSPTVNIVLDGGQLFNNNVVLSISGSRTIRLDAGGGFVRSGYGKTTTINGQITGVGGFGVVWDGSPLVLTSGTNNYAGNTTIGTVGNAYWNDGTARLDLGVDNAIPYGPGTGNVVFGVNPHDATKLAVLNLNGHNAQINGLTGGTNAVIDNYAGGGPYTLTVGNNDRSSVFAGTVQNSVALAKTGSGNLTLIGTNTYSGLTTVNGGTLQFGDGTAGHDSSIPGAVLNNAALVLNLNGNQTCGGLISGSGSLTKIGNGTLTLVANSTYSGPTVIAGGTINFPSPLSTANINIGGAHGNTVSGSYGLTGGSLSITGAGDDFWGGTEQGMYVYKQVSSSQSFDVAVHIATMAGGDGSWAKAGIMARQDASNNNVNTVFDAETTGSRVSFQWTNTTQDKESGSSVGPNWLRMTYDAATQNFVGYESPSTSPTAPPPADTSWVPINNYVVPMTGSTFLLGIADTSHNNPAFNTASFDNIGGLLSNVNVLPTTTNLLIASRATLDLSGGSQQVRSLSDNVRGLGGTIINGIADFPSTLTLSPTGGMTSTFSGMIRGGGGLGKISLVMSGSGTQVLSGFNTYTGSTTISSGTLRLGPPTLLSDSFLNTSLDASKWTTNTSTNWGGATSQVNATPSGVQLVSRGYLNTASQYDPTKLGGLDITGNWTFTGGADDFLQIDTRSSGTPNLGFYGENTNAIEFFYEQKNDNTTAPTIQTRGSFSVTNVTSTGKLNVNVGDNLYFHITDGGLNNLLTFTLMDLTNSMSAAATATLQGGVATANYVTFHNREGGNDISLVSNVVFSNVQGGGNNELPTTTPLAIAATAIFDLAGGSQQVASLSDFNGSGGTVTNSSNTNLSSILTVTPSSGLSTTYSGTIQDGAVAGGLRLMLNGEGALELDGVNTYTGGTAVLGGTLVLASPSAIQDGTSLSVGADASTIFGTAAAGANSSAAPSLAAVPEPGTLVLLLAGLAAGFGVWRKRGMRG